MNENRKVPKIRFKGFTDDWEQRKLGEIGSTYTGLSGKSKNDFGHGKAHFVTYMNVFSNPISNVNMIEPIELDNKQNLVQKGDVFFTTSSETPGEVGMSSVWPINTRNVYLNSFCFGYRPEINFNLNYLGYLLRSDLFRKKMIFLAQGISRYNISKNAVMNINVSIPNIDEQVKIGDLLSELDNLITLHQYKLEKLQNIKKSLLDKMFPKNDSKIPEIRFKGFTDDWEQRKFDEVLDLITDYVAAGSFADLADNVKYLPKPDYAQLIRTTDLKSNFKNNDFVYVNKNAFNYLWRVNLNKESIIMPNIGNCGEIYYVNKEKLKYKNNVLGPNAILVRSSKYSNKFLSYNFITNKFQEKLSLIISPNGQTKFNKTDLKTLEIIIPQKQEQNKIGNLFNELDNLITLHQSKLEKLQNIKKSLLEKMFI